MRDRRFWLPTLAAAAVGVAVRLYYVLVVVRGNIALTGDAETYHLLGRVLASGEGYVRPREFLDDGTSLPTAEFPPLWPMFLGALDLLGIDSAVGQRTVGALLGGVTIVVIAVLARAVADRTVGIAAAWVAALYPQLVVFDGSLLSEGLYAPLVAVLLWAVIEARRADDDRRRTRWWILASVATGLAVVTRTEALLYVPFLLVPATRRADRRAWARTAAIVCAGVVVVLGVWTARNAVSLGHFQPFTNNGGTAIAGANCDRVYSGVQIGGWRLDCVPSIDFDEMDETEGAVHAREVGLRYARDHVGEVPTVVAARLGRTFGVWDVRSNLFFEALEGRDYDWLWAAWYSWLVLAPLAVYGVYVQRRDGRQWWPLLTPFAVAIVVTIVLYGNQRFRMGAEPSVVVFASIGTVTIARWLASRRTGADQPAQAPAGSS